MKRQIKIIKNAIRCKKCGEVLESKHVHDWVCCRCFKMSNGKEGCFCDGGLEYLRRGGDPESYESLCETRPFTDEEMAQLEAEQRGICEEYDWDYDKIWGDE